MNTCERCGEGYRFFVDHGGHKLCRGCWDRCSVCGQKLPLSNKIGNTMSMGTALFTPMATLQIAGRLERQDKPWIGSGLCMNCYHAKEKQEQDEERLLREAKLAKAREILETPTVWECGYCNTVNKGKFCSNCGSPRKKQESQVSSSKTVTANSKQERENKPEPSWYEEALKQHTIQLNGDSS
jgi:hypothetical protein